MLDALLTFLAVFLGTVLGGEFIRWKQEKVATDPNFRLTDVLVRPKVEYFPPATAEEYDDYEKSQAETPVSVIRKRFPWNSTQKSSPSSDSSENME